MIAHTQQPSGNTGNIIDITALGLEISGTPVDIILIMDPLPKREQKNHQLTRLVERYSLN